MLPSADFEYKDCVLVVDSDPGTRGKKHRLLLNGALLLQQQLHCIVALSRYVSSEKPVP